MTHSRSHIQTCLLPPRSLPRALPDLIVPPPLRPFLLGIQHEAEHIEGELRVLEAHVAEAALGLVAQDVGALAPEAGHGFADGEVGARGVGVDVAGVGNLREGGRGDEVDFGVGEGFKELGFDSFRQLIVGDGSGCTGINLMMRR